MDRAAVVASVRSPSSAAVAGLVFAATLGAAILLLHSAAPDDVAQAGQWLDDTQRRDAVYRALSLMPFAGIAFLWFIAVVRTHLGSREDRFFETVFLGSGLLFVGMLFTATAVVTAVIGVQVAVGLSPGVVTFGWVLASTLLGQFGLRMAAVFTLSISTAGVRSGYLPRWLALVGYATGLLLLVTPPLPASGQLLFPAWVAVLSVLVIVRGLRGRASAPGAAGPA